MTPRLGSLLTRPHRRAAAGEQGSGTVETVIIAGGLLTVFFAAIQVALFLMAGSAARGAAQEGARVAAAETATIQDGIAVASAFASDSSNIFETTTVTGSRTGETVTVTVTGTALSLLPLIIVPTTQTAVMPVERITG